MSVEVRFLGENIDFTEKGSCFGFFNRLEDKEAFKKCDSLIFYPSFYNYTFNIGEVNLFLRDILNIINPYLFKDYKRRRITVESVIREGIQISTKYPSSFIVGIFEIIRDAFYYPPLIKNYVYLYHELVTILRFNQLKSIKLAYYIARIQHCRSDSALWVKEIRKGEWKFLDKNIIEPKLLSVASIKENPRYQGVNSFFKCGDFIDIRGKEVLFYKQAQNLPHPKTLTKETVDRIVKNYKYSREEIQEIINIIM